MATKLKYGGDAQLITCGKNTVTGVGMAINETVKVTERKPAGARPTMPNLNGTGIKAAAAKKIRTKVKAAQAKWDKQEKKWKAAKTAALKKVEKLAKTNAEKIATTHMNDKMGAKKCLKAGCQILVKDPNMKANGGTLLGKSYVSGNYAHASAQSKWSASPECKKPEPKKKKMGKKKAVIKKKVRKQMRK